MSSTLHKVLLYLLSFLLLLATGLSAWSQQWYWLLLPFALLACFCLIQYPLYALYLLLASIPWSVEFHFTSSLGTDLPDEPLMLLAALAGLLVLLYQRNIRITSHVLLLIVAAQLGWAAITILTSTDPLVSIKYLLAKSWYVLAFLVLPAYLFREQKLVRRCAIILLVSMLASMSLALLRQGTLGWAFAKVNDALKPFYRNHVNYSSLLVFMVPLEIACLRHLSSKAAKAALYTVLVVTVGALVLSYARGSWVALLTGLVAYPLIRRKRLVLGFLLFVALSVASALWLGTNDHYLRYSNDFKTTIFHQNFEEHLLATYRMKDMSTAERFYRWVAGVRMVPDSWRSGFGANTFYENYKSYTVPAFRTWVSNNEEHSTIHNYFLLMLVEQGAIGLLLFLVLLGALFWYAQKIYHQSNDRFTKTLASTVAALLVMICTINFLSDMIETDKVGSVFYLCVACLVKFSPLRSVRPSGRCRAG